MVTQRTGLSVNIQRATSSRLRPCSPLFLLLLVTALAGVVVVQEITMQSVTHTETYYRKALFTIGNRRGQTVAAKIEEIKTTKTFNSGQAASKANPQGAANVDTAGAAQGIGTAANKQLVQVFEMETGTETVQQGNTAGTNAGAATVLGREDMSQAQQLERQRQQAIAEAAAKEQNQQAAAAAETQRPANRSIIEQQSLEAGTQKTEDEQQAAMSAAMKQAKNAATAIQQNPAAAGAAQAVEAAAAAEQQAAAMEVDGIEQVAAAAEAAAEKRQAEAAAFAVDQATAAAASEEEAAAAAAAQAQQAEAAVAAGQRAAAAADDVQPVGPVEDEWWSELREPRQRQAEMLHGVTVRLVQPDALRNPSDIAAAADARAAAQGIGGAGSGDAASCKIYVLDAAREFGPLVGAPICEVNSPFIWPFGAPGRGIDGADLLEQQDSQYAAGYWIAQTIKGSAYEAADLPEADFVYVDMHCYHMWWMSWHHPLGSKNMTDPTRYIQRTYEMLQDMPRFMDSGGADFGLLQPGPTLGALFSEAVLCEDLASVYHMVTERSSLCVWTRDSAERGQALVLPYVATTDLGLKLPEQPRDIFLYFRGGCGSPDPSVRHQFAAGKMLRYWLVERLQGQAPDVEVACSCDICANHELHALMMAKMRRAVFCPIVASNVQSSRRLSEAVLAGCIPVFIGPPFHSVPMVRHVDYAGMALFLNVNNTGLWIDRTSVRWEHNHMISKAWKLDDALSGATVTVPTLDSVLGYLRALSAEVVRQKQEVLRRERLKFYYPPAPEGAGGRAGRSELGDIILGEMCVRAAEAKRRRAAALEQEAAEAGAADPQQLQQQQ